MYFPFFFFFPPHPHIHPLLINSTFYVISCFPALSALKYYWSDMLFRLPYTFRYPLLSSLLLFLRDQHLQSYCKSLCNSLAVTILRTFCTWWHLLWFEPYSSPLNTEQYQCTYVRELQVYKDTIMFVHSVFGPVPVELKEVIPADALYSR